MVATTQNLGNSGQNSEYVKVTIPSWLADKNRKPATLYCKIVRSTPKAVLVNLKAEYYHYGQDMWLPSSQITITPFDGNVSEIPSLINADLVDPAFIESLLVLARNKTNRVADKPHVHDVVPRETIHEIVDAIREHIKNNGVKDSIAMQWWIENIISSHTSFANSGMYLWAVEGIFNFNVYLPGWSIHLTSPIPDYKNHTTITPVDGKRPADPVETKEA